jgi:hypothetical protein
MKFILDVAPINKKIIYDKIKRYMREAEDFYLAYTHFEPRMTEFYTALRPLYEKLRTAYYEQTLTMPQST